MTVAESESPPTREQELEALVRRMQSELAATTDQLAAATSKIASITNERDNLRRAYRQLMEQFDLLRRRIFIAKAERVDATQLELEFEKTKKKLNALAQQLGSEATNAAASDDSDDPSAPGARPRESIRGCGPSRWQRGNRYSYLQTRRTLHPVAHPFR